MLDFCIKASLVELHVDQKLDLIGYIIVCYPLSSSLEVFLNESPIFSRSNSGCDRIGGQMASYEALSGDSKDQSLYGVNPGNDVKKAE